MTRFCNLVVFDHSALIIHPEGPFTTDTLLLNPLAYPDDNTLSFYPYLQWPYTVPIELPQIGRGKPWQRFIAPITFLIRKLNAKRSLIFSLYQIQ